MAKPDELQLLKSRMKVLEQRVHGIAADLEKLELECVREALKATHLGLDFGRLKRSVERNKERWLESSSLVAGRTVELRDRITALETRFFKTIGDFVEVERIIGAEPSTSPPELDKRPILSRRRPRRR